MLLDSKINKINGINLTTNRKNEETFELDNITIGTSGVTKVIKHEVTYGKKLPALFERGGAYSHTGFSRIVANNRGLPRRPTYIKSKGDLCCQDHALITIRVGDIVAEGVRTGHNTVCVTVYKINDIKNGKVYLESINDATGIPGFHAVVFAAAKKALHYHCRRPYYVWVDNDDRDKNLKWSKLETRPFKKESNTDNNDAEIEGGV